MKCAIDKFHLLRVLKFDRITKIRKIKLMNKFDFDFAFLHHYEQMKNGDKLVYLSVFLNNK